MSVATTTPKKQKRPKKKARKSTIPMTARSTSEMLKGGYERLVSEHGTSTPARVLSVFKTAHSLLASGHFVLMEITFEEGVFRVWGKFSVEGERFFQQFRRKRMLRKIKDVFLEVEEALYLDADLVRRMGLKPHLQTIHSMLNDYLAKNPNKGAASAP